MKSHLANRALPLAAAIPALLMCSCATFTSAGDEADDGDAVVTLDQVPPAVRQTIEAHLGGASINEIERSTDEGPVPYYGVEATGPGGKFEFEVTEDGTYRPDAEEEDDDGRGDDQEDDGR